MAARCSEIQLHQGLLAACICMMGLSAPAAQDSGSNLAAGELSQAEQRAQTCSASNAAGVGLQGEYFAQRGLHGAPLLVRIDGPIDLDSTLEWPTDGKSVLPKSVRWTGWIKAPFSGAYRFHGDPAHTRIAVANQAMVGKDAKSDAALQMSAGRFYPITVEVDDIVIQDQRLRLEWTAPHGLRYLVPRALLFAPTETVAKAASNKLRN